ncbi:hypothetical protein EGY19_13775 [Burkholderia multivorans]|uniref:hypothetical protein n=1 Tax=Burkholderia multivorans TaxID=87883 RepID=UPI000CFFC536|nr:hypothetical protein [Burkholderia multivorans]AYY98409.1 hypothetical protein EGY19_13775 [Burkholderia multivorans]MBU9120522.1 hypothetical protein [Burkholderia multivorans]PRF46563.1 hypothetical protein C6Q04_22090 [Burkholderia multivorans]PRG56253.1 hypothetical protein C6T63_05160 [Burkholderia multivorans]PRG79242.1 hypothetical protein C6T58_17815 [Burkholderia multivorans]
MKIAIIAFGALLLGASTITFAQSSSNDAYGQWRRASKEANAVFLAGRKVYDSGNAPPTCASALKSQYELGQKVERLLETAMQTVNAMGGPNNPDAQAYFASNLRTASSEVASLDSNTRASCGLR